VVAPGEVEHPHGRLGRTWADDLEADAVDLLQGLAPLHQRREYEVAERSVLEQERSERVSLDSDVPQRLRHDRRHEHRLTGEQIHLTEEPGRSVAHDLAARRIDDRDLTLDNRDERVRAVADAIEDVADLRAALLTQRAEPPQLRRRERRTGGSSHQREPTRMIACHRGACERPGSPRAVERDRGHDSLVGEPGIAELEIEAGASRLRRFATIFCATVSGAPTWRAPSGPADAPRTTTQIGQASTRL
jgi:hypothetical protein